MCPPSSALRSGSEPSRCYRRTSYSAIAAVLQQLAEQLEDRVGEGERLEAELGKVRQVLQGKEVERERILALYRRGRIEEKALDQQLDEIDHEEKAIKEH